MLDPRDEEREAFVMRAIPAEYHVLALSAPDGRLLWAMKQDGTLVIGEGCGPQEAVEWLSKMWNQYGSPAAVRRAAFREAREAVAATRVDGKWVHNEGTKDALAALTRLEEA